MAGIETPDESKLAETLFIKYYSMLLTYIVKCGAGDADAEDIAGDVYEKTVRYIRKFVGVDEKYRKRLLICFARSSVIDRRRRKGVSAVVPFSSLDDDETAESSEDSVQDPTDTQKTAEDRETLTEIKRRIKNLGSPDAEIMIMRYYLGFSPKELAQIFGMNQSTVRSVLSRGREKITGKGGGDDE